MVTKSRLSLIASVTFVLAGSVVVVDAQPFGRGPGFMMGPGMMDRGAFGRMCGPAANGFAEWQLGNLEQSIKFTDPQRAKFEELKTASSKATEIMRKACPADLPRTVVARMEVMEKRAEATLQAIKTMRPAMEAFYGTLTDEQRTRLDFQRWSPPLLALARPLVRVREGVSIDAPSMLDAWV